ncbi:uncharacterized protein LOC126557489 [Anopheles maculipalpis]|uniref:uncharacterized protein LOC126557489 n=1 Tax=Anopheles maculipalpis TaxID=1496333 RepID=UPI0021595D36|nr:uncharacterized protein LOC126557489 [Anopheles maculipalpis]
MMIPIRWQSSSRRTWCSIHVLLLLVLLLSGVLVSGSRVRSKKHRTSRGTSAVGRWQSRTDGTSNAIHELGVKPAPFSKPAHSGATGGGPKKRSYYVPAVTNLENNLQHFINNLKTGIGSSKLAHAVNGVTGAIQQAVSMPGHGPINLLGSHRPVAGIHNAAGYYSNANELRYGQPFSKQAGGHFKTSPVVYGKKNVQGPKRGRHSSTASPPGKYDSLMSDLGISGYKHFENAVIRDLERREELKVEATIHTLFPDASDDDWRPIASIKKTPLTSSVVRGAAPELSESKIVTSLTAGPSDKRPLDTTVRSAKPKPTATGASSAVRYGLTNTSVSPKSTTAPNHKHRSKTASIGKEKRTKDRVKCSNCVTSTSTTVSSRPSSSATYPTTPKQPPAVGAQSQRFGPTYDASMFYGNNGKAPAAVAQSYSNVEVQYNNRTIAPPFAVSPWTQMASVGQEEVSTQSAPPVTTFTALTEPSSSVSSNGLASFYSAGVKKSYIKTPKPYVPGTVYVGQTDATVTSTTTHKPTGGSQGTKGTTKKRTNHHHNHHHNRPETGSSAASHRRAAEKPGDSVGAGSSKTELRVKKKFDPKYSRNRGTIKFKDALEKNPDQIYR